MLSEAKSMISGRQGATASLTLAIAVAVVVAVGPGWASAAGKEGPGRNLERQRPGLRLSAAMKQALNQSGHPEFMADGLAPTAEMLWQWQADKKVGSGLSRIPLNARALNAHVLPLFEQVQRPTHYLFNGNGMYQTYLIAKALFKDTAMVHRLHFLPVSKSLGNVATSHELDRYLELIGVARTKDDLAIVDSYTTGGAIRRSAQAVRSYLVAKGESKRSSIQRVISLGIRESTSQINNDTTMARYQQSMRALDPEALFASRDSLSHPIVQAGQWHEFWYSLWQAFAGGHYWGHKYDSVDERGLPTAGALTNPGKLQERVATAQSYLRTMSDTRAMLKGDGGMQMRVAQIVAQQAPFGIDKDTVSEPGTRADRLGIFRPFSADLGPMAQGKQLQVRRTIKGEQHRYQLLDARDYAAYSHAVQQLLKTVTPGKEQKTIFVGVGRSASPVLALLESLNPQLTGYLPIDNAHELTEGHGAHVAPLVQTFLPTINEGTEIVLFQQGDGRGLAKVQAQLAAIAPRGARVRAVALHDRPRVVPKGIEVIDTTARPVLQALHGPEIKAVAPISRHRVGKDALPDGNVRSKYKALMHVMRQFAQRDQALDALLGQPTKQ